MIDYFESAAVVYDMTEYAIMWHVYHYKSKSILVVLQSLYPTTT